MRLASLLDRFRDWRENRAILAEARRLSRDDEPYQGADHAVLLNTIQTAAFCEDAEGTVKAFNELRSRAPEVAISSKTAIRSLVAVRQLDLAEAVLKEGLKKYPGANELLLVYADIPRLRGDWPEARQRAQVVRKQLSGNVTGYLWEAMALKEMGQFDEADTLLLQAIALEPTYPPPTIEYAEVAERRGDLDEALRRWTLMRERIEDQFAWVRSARILCKMNREDEALELLTAARWRFQSRPEPMAEIARILRSRGQVEDAVQQWQAVREQYPQSETGYIEGARLLRELGRMDEAEAILQTYSDRRDPNPVGVIEWARMAQRRDMAEAAQRWEIVRERFPEREEGYIEGAAALEAIGKHEAAQDVRAQQAVRKP
jgi:predicted Zn-dependent protease